MSTTTERLNRAKATLGMTDAAQVTTISRLESAKAQLGMTTAGTPVQNQTPQQQKKPYVGPPVQNVMAMQPRTAATVIATQGDRNKFARASRGGSSTRPLVSNIQQTAQEVKKPKRTFFEKGAFDDGYQFGDVVKSLVGTDKDIIRNIGAGAKKMAENALDAGATAVGAVSDLVGADGLADKMKNFVAKDLSGGEGKLPTSVGRASTRLLPARLQPIANAWSAISKLDNALNKGEDESVLGDRSDALVQGATRFALQQGLAASGVPWQAVSGVTSFGGEAESAFNQDATYGEAALSGAISAGGEILSEYLLGGMFGETGLDDKLVKSLTQKIANKTLRGIVNIGIKAGGEGLIEEPAAWAISKIGQRLSYADDKTLKELMTSEEAIDDLVDSVLGGLLFGTAVQGLNAIAGAAGGADTKEAGTTAQSDAPVQGEISRSDGVSVQPTTDTTTDGNAIRDMPGNATGVLQSETSRDTVKSTDPRVARALEMLESGAPGSQIYNETGLVATNSELTDGFGGPTVWRLRDGRGTGTEVRFGGTSDGAPETGVSEHDRGGVETGRDSNGKRPTWDELDESRRLAAIKSITDAMDVAYTDELASLRALYGDDAALAERIYNDYASGNVVLEQWTHLLKGTEHVSDALDQIVLPKGTGAASKDFNINRGPQVDTQSRSTVENKNLTPEQRAQDKTDLGIYNDESVGAAALARGPQVPTQFSLKDSEWGTQEMRDAIDPGTHEQVGRALRHARAQGRLMADSDGNLLYVEEISDDLLGAESWDRIDQTLATSYLAPELFRRGDMGRYTKLMERIVKNRSEAGGMLQEAQDYHRTPDGKVAQAIQAVEAINDTKNRAAERNSTNVSGTAKAAKTIVESEVDAAANVASEEAEKSRRVSKRRGSRFTEFNPDGTFKVGTKVRAKDRGNIGTIVSYDPASDTYMVRFKSKDGLTATIPMRSDMLEAITADAAANDERTADAAANDERTVGERLAERLLKQAEPNFNTPSEEQSVLSNLLRFANDKGAPKGERRVGETVVDRLKHFFANRDMYDKAWQRMQAVINEKGFAEQNPELLSAFNDILGTSGASIDGMHTGEIIRAVIEGSKELGISTATIREYAALDAEYAVAEKLAQDLVEQTGASGIDAVGIDLAVRDYVAKLAAEDTATDRLGSILGKAAKGSGVKISEILTRSWQDKAQARQAIADFVVAEYGLSGDEAIAAADAISQRFYNELAARSQTSLEARFKPRGKRKSKTNYEKFSELLINLDAINDNVFRDLAVQSIYGEDVSLTEAEIRQIHSLMEQSIAVRESDAQLADIMEANANKIIASKMPKTFKKKLTTALYNSMLGNLKTLIARNAGGNIALAAVEQVPTKIFSAVADATIGKVTGERYRAMPNADYYKAYGKGFAKGVKDFASDFASDVHTPRSGETATYEMQYEPFKSEFMNEVNKLVRAGLEIGDRPFYEAQYAARMSELNRLKAGRKLSSEQEAEFNEWAPIVARMDALNSVFQTKSTKDNPDAAKTAEGLKKLREGVDGIVQGVTGIDIAGQAALPFTGTPGNMLETTADYLPVVGLAKNAIQSAREIHQGRFNQARASQQLGRQATGALLAVAARALFNSGVISGGGNDRDKELLEQSGWQEYSIKIGNHWYGYEWIPIIGPLMAGTADYFEARKYGEESLIGALGTAVGTVAEMSALQGLNRLFGGYGNTVEGFADAVTGLPSQAIPSAVRQFAKTADEYERMTYDPNAVVSELKYIASGIPFLRDKLPEAVDMFGNPVEAGDGRGYGARALENFVSPGWLSEENDDPLTRELLRLADGGNSVSIGAISNTYKDSNGRTVKMSAEQYHDYQVTRGTTMAEIMGDIMSNPAYAQLTDAQKSEAMSYAVDIADAAAKAELYGGAGIKYDNDYDKVLALGDNAGDYVLFKEAYGEVYNAYDRKAPVNAEDAKALDSVLDNLSKLDKDVLEMLDNVSGFTALKSASEAGVGVEDYFKSKAAIRDTAAPEGYSENPSWQKFQIIASMGLGDATALALIEEISSEGTAKKIREAYNAGVPLNEIVDYYEAINSRKSDGTEKKSADKLDAVMKIKFSNANNMIILDSIF